MKEMEASGDMSQIEMAHDQDGYGQRVTREGIWKTAGEDVTK